MQFPSGSQLSPRIVGNIRAAVAVHVSRGTDPVQIGRYLRVCGQPPDPRLPFCAAGASFYVVKSVAELIGMPFDAGTAVEAFRSLIPFVEQHWIKVSASCEEVRQWAIRNGRWVGIDGMPDDMEFLPTMVALMNFKDGTEQAHHYGTFLGDLGDTDEVSLGEFNTSDVSSGNGGCVEVKRRLLSSDSFRGVVVPLGLPMPAEAGR